MNDNPEILYLGDVQRLELGNDDILVLTCHGRISAETAERLKAQAQSILPGRKIMVLEDSITVGVIAAKKVA